MKKYAEPLKERVKEEEILELKTKPRELLLQENHQRSRKREAREEREARREQDKRAREVRREQEKIAREARKEQDKKEREDRKKLQKELKERASGEEQTRRVTSITRRMHAHVLGKQIRSCLFADLLLGVVSFVCYLMSAEFMRFGRWAWNTNRTFEMTDSWKHIWYRAQLSDSAQVAVIDILPFVNLLIPVLIGFFVVQVFVYLLQYRSEDRKIRKILSPINEIALQADRLSRMSFTEDKYQLLEDAIEKIKPEDARTLSFGDSDLVGVEAAMNNLLLRMRDTYRQQARFVNDASHELRTPIAVIQGYANMLDRWGKEDEKILDESITAIRNESDHMNHLVEQLLFLARGDSGKTVVNKETIDLTAMMQEIYEESFMIDEGHLYRFRPAASGTSEAASFSGEEDGKAMPALMYPADAALLKQAVRILVDNAAKYTKAGDEILLSVGKSADGSVYLEVQDSGIGMAEADVQHMFERFYRSDEVRSYQGTGLGLSIAKWIVDKHGGHFEILSRTGLGTRIRIVLP